MRRSQRSGIQPSEASGLREASSLPLGYMASALLLSWGRENLDRLNEWLCEHVFTCTSVSAICLGTVNMRDLKNDQDVTLTSKVEGDTTTVGVCEFVDTSYTNRVIHMTIKINKYYFFLIITIILNNNI